MTADPRPFEAATDQPGQTFEPVLEVTLYDRVTSLLLSLIFTTGGLTVALGVIWWANHAPARHSGPTPILPIDVDMGEPARRGQDAIYRTADCQWLRFRN